MSDGEDDERELNPAVKALQAATPEFVRRSFAIKFGLVLLVMALSIGTIGVVATQTITNETESNVESEFQGDAQQQADIIEQWIDGNSLRTELRSEDLELGADGDPDQVLERIRAQEGIEHAHLIENDPAGELPVLASTDLASGTTLTELEDPDRNWLVSNWVSVREDATEDVVVTDTYTVGDQRVVGFIRQTAVNSNRYIWVEASVFDVQQSLRGANPDDDVGFTQVVNTGSYEIGSSDENVVMIDARGENGKLLEVYATEESTLEPIRRAAELRGQEQRAGVIAEMEPDSEVIDESYTVGYAPIEDTDWVVVTHGPRSEVFGFVDTLGTWGIIVTLFSVLLIAVTGSVLGYSTATSIDRLTSKTDDMQGGNLDVDFSTSRVDNIGRLYDGFGEMQAALKAQIQESEQARKEAEVARAEAEELASYLQEKAEEYSEVMQQVSAGDLTQRMEQDGEEASMDRIAEEFNDMIEELEKTTGQLKSYVDEVEEAGAEVEQSARTVREASEQVADSIQKISDDAYEQKEGLVAVSESMDDLADEFESLADEQDVDMGDSLDRIRQNCDDLDELAQLSEETMAESEEVAGAAEEQAAELNTVSDRANDLQRYAQPLRDILERFETEEEHEFVFSVGPTGGAASPSSDDEEEAED